MTLNVYTPTRQFQIRDEMVFRTYTAGQMKTLLQRVNTFEVLATFDFAYDIEEPRPVDGATEDVVYVLRRR